MSRNSLRNNLTRLHNPQLNDAPRPGDYKLCSVESRVAARALLEAKAAGDQQNKIRFIVEHIGMPRSLETSTCQRYLCVSGTLMEILHLGTSGELSMDQVEQLVSRIPVDGKTYALAKPDFLRAHHATLL